MSKTGVFSIRLGVLLFALSAILTACKAQEELRDLDHRFMVVQDPAYIEVNFCTQKAEVIKTRTKYLIVLDKSGSNAINYQVNPDGSIATPFNPQPMWATDPDGSRRYTALIDFLNNSPTNDPDRYYGLINFSTNASVVQTNGQNFTNNLSAFRTRIQGQIPPADSGSTNYIGALDAINNTVKADIDAAKAAANGDPTKIVASTYIVIFISDGAPIVDLDMTTTPPTPTMQDPAKVLARVRDLLMLKTDNGQYVDSINLYTGYYYVNGNEDPNAKQLLLDMAKAGVGVSYPFGSGAVIDFSLFQVPQKTIKYGLTDIFVSNKNVTWWNGGLMRDADGDGLPDDIERVNGSSSTRVDSDGNGVSDYIEYTLYTRPCLNATCTVAGARNYVRAGGICNSLTNWTANATTQRVTVPDSDKDGLNDCEEIALVNIAGINEYDSNGDLIPDGLSFLKGIDFKAGSHPAFSDSDQDGMVNYSEIKFGMPVQFPNFQLHNLNPLSYDLKVSSSTEVQDCYTLKVTNMPTLGDNNMIRVEFIESATEVVNRKKYRVAEKAYSGAAKTLTINELPNENAGVWK